MKSTLALMLLVTSLTMAQSFEQGEYELELLYDADVAQMYVNPLHYPDNNRFWAVFYEDSDDGKEKFFSFVADTTQYLEIYNRIVGVPEGETDIMNVTDALTLWFTNIQHEGVGYRVIVSYPDDESQEGGFTITEEQLDRLFNIKGR